jgi:hypothetical protein
MADKLGRVLMATTSVPSPSDLGDPIRLRELARASLLKNWARTPVPLATTKKFRPSSGQGVTPKTGLVRRRRTLTG